MDDVEFNDIKYCIEIFTRFHIYNVTPLGVQQEIQGQQLPINELNGTPPEGACPISNLHLCKKYSETIQPNVDDKEKNKKTNTLRLTQEFNEKFFTYTRKRIDISNLSIMKDDIKNYRPLTDIQLEQVQQLSEAEKIEIIKTYNIMFASIENVINI